MEVKETAFDYNCRRKNEKHIEKSENQQYLKEIVDKGLDDIELRRYMDHETAIKHIRKKLGFNCE